jgi:hypothetical protein
MYYSLNNEKKPVKRKNLPDTVLGSYMKPQLIGRKVVTIQNTPIKIKPKKLAVGIRLNRRQSQDTPFKILSRVSLNHSDQDESNSNNTLAIDNTGIIGGYNYNRNLKSLQLASINTGDTLLPPIETKSSSVKRSDTLERDYIKTEESLISRYRLQNLGLKNTYKNIVKTSLNSLNISKYNKYDLMPTNFLTLKTSL